MSLEYSGGKREKLGVYTFPDGRIEAHGAGNGPAEVQRSDPP